MVRSIQAPKSHGNQYRALYHLDYQYAWLTVLIVFAYDANYVRTQVWWLVAPQSKLGVLYDGLWSGSAAFSGAHMLWGQDCRGVVQWLTWCVGDDLDTSFHVDLYCPGVIVLRAIPVRPHWLTLQKQADADNLRQAITNLYSSLLNCLVYVPDQVVIICRGILCWHLDLLRERVAKLDEVCALWGVLGRRYGIMSRWQILPIDYNRRWLPQCRLHFCSVRIQDAPRKTRLTSFTHVGTQPIRQSRLVNVWLSQPSL